MQKVKQLLGRPAVLALSLALAAACFGVVAIHGAQAALREESAIFESQVATQSIGVQLLEAGTPVSGEGALMKSLLGEDTQILPGKAYTEKLTVKNTGSIDEFVRVSVVKYWLDASGNKVPGLDSSLITLGLVTNGGWSIDAASTTEERTVLYLGTALTPGQESPAFLETVALDPSIVNLATQSSVTTDGLTTIATIFPYDGCQLCLQVTVDGVQTHNGDDAIQSAWGVEASTSASGMSIG